MIIKKVPFASPEDNEKKDIFFLKEIKQQLKTKNHKQIRNKRVELGPAC